MVAAAALAFSSCAPVEQPVSNQQIAAVEVPLLTPTDRADFLAMLHRHAKAGGLHVDDVSEQWRLLGERSGDPPEARSQLAKTIYVGLWRGERDDDPEVLVDDGGHQGRAWATFLRGKHPELATKVRTGLMAEITERWPSARPIPVMPNGALPLHSDVVWTGTAYVVKPDRIAAYAARGGQH